MAAMGGEVIMIYDDNDVSMEEKRALLDKYKYDEELLKEKTNQLNQSIANRLSNLRELV